MSSGPPPKRLKQTVLSFMKKDEALGGKIVTFDDLHDETKPSQLKTI